MNKRIIIAAITVLFLGLVGCHKLDIKPHTNCEETRTEESFEKGIKNSGDEDFDRNGGDGDLITDPNHDEDEDQQTKR